MSDHAQEGANKQAEKHDADKKFPLGWVLIGFLVVLAGVFAFNGMFSRLNIVLFFGILCLASAIIYMAAMGLLEADSPKKSWGNSQFWVCFSIFLGIAIALGPIVLPQKWRRVMEQASWDYTPEVKVERDPEPRIAKSEDPDPKKIDLKDYVIRKVGERNADAIRTPDAYNVTITITPKQATEGFLVPKGTTGKIWYTSKNPDSGGSYTERFSN